ncbi:MAG: hypothetical protein P8M34_02825 [Saprospiraceae bacterium]|nr:hypothetical protein [Saprospiraceae bacterium]|tara:strand:+ start:1675 stop:2004 length:330 start_codon:yes stop_codon:yes gene_type:complete
MKFSFIIFISLYFTVSSFGQEKVKINQKFTLTDSFVKNPILKPLTFKVDKKNHFTTPSLMVQSKYDTPFVEYNTTIFCKFEHKLMMSSRLPLKMRIGDVQYVDRLEGKK